MLFYVKGLRFIKCAKNYLCKVNHKDTGTTKIVLQIFHIKQNFFNINKLMKMYKTKFLFNHCTVENIQVM